MRRVRVRRARRRREGGFSLLRVSRSLPQMSMSQVAKEWDRLSKAEKERRRSLVVRHVYGGDVEAFNRDVEARPRTVGRVLLHIDRIIGDAPKPAKPTKTQKVKPKKAEKPRAKVKPQKKAEKPIDEKAGRAEPEKPVKPHVPSFNKWWGVSLDELERIPGVGPKTVEALRRAGYEDVAQVYRDSVSGWGSLAAVNGIGPETAKNLFREIESRVPTKNQLKAKPEKTVQPPKEKPRPLFHVDRIEPGLRGGWEVWVRNPDGRGYGYKRFDTFEEAVAYARRGEGGYHDISEGDSEARWTPTPPPPRLPQYLKEFKNRHLGTTVISEKPVYIEGRGWLFEKRYRGPGDMRTRFTVEELQEEYDAGQKAIAERKAKERLSKTLERPKGAKARLGWEQTVKPYTVLAEFATNPKAWAPYHSVPYARVKVEGDQVEIVGMDPSHVSLTRIRFPNEGLIPDGEYAIEESYTGYKSPLKHPTKVEWDAPDSTLRFHKGSYTAEFKLAPPDAIDAPEIPTPKIYYQARFKMRLEPLLKLVRNAADDMQTMKVVMAPRESGDRTPAVMFTWARGYGHDKAVTEEIFEEGRGPDYPLLNAEFLENTDHVSAYYDPSYLLPFLERLKRMGFETVAFEYRQDMPLHIVADDLGFAEAEFWEAPKIVTDEEAGV